MKKLLLTTVMISGLGVGTALADKYVLDANGNFYNRETVFYAHEPIDQDRDMDMAKEDFVSQNEGSTIETQDPAIYGRIEFEGKPLVEEDKSELSLWERFKNSFE